MHKIEKIKVSGFWGVHTFEVNLFPDVTFFIGVNGTGKTTFINLVAAALYGDLTTLEQLPFSSLEITLNTGINNKKASIFVTKKKTKNRPFEEIQYRIRDAHSNEEKTFSLDELSEQFALRDGDAHFLRARDYLLRSRRHPNGLMESIQKLVQVSWLSIHRISGQQRANDDKSYESTVDRKLEQQSNDLVKYFSSLSQQKDEEVRLFQELIFLSLLDETGTTELFKARSESDLAMQKIALEEIFRELKVSEKTFSEHISNFFGHSEQIAQKLRQNENAGFSTEELSNMVGQYRLNNVIDRWQTLQARQSEIFAQRDKFLMIVNKLFQGKKIEISESNEIRFTNQQEKQMGVKFLSSGEKQLLILLAEALLQRSRPYIFIADEPELSLHVTWQEKLIGSLRTLNDSAQLIVATHSPDIVGNRSANVIDMETLIS